jgi:4-carboxymuconolactone decarboxylase
MIDQHPAHSASPHDAVRAREAEILGKPPRILPLAPEEFTPEARQITDALHQAVGLPPNAPVPDFIATMLRHPLLHKVHTELALVLMSRGALSDRDRELAVLRVGWLCQAPYEWNSHVNAGKRLAGLTTDEIERVTIGSAAPEWNDADRTLLRAVEEMLEDAMISEETWRALATRLDEKQLIELPILVGQYLGVAYLQNAMRATLMPGQVGLGAR